MDYRNHMTLTREKHLDHLVRVVPFIVLCYAIQCFVILKVSPQNFSTIGLSVLGGFLALMIAGFITYDLKHKVHFYEHELQISFLGRSKTIYYDDIWSMDISDPGQSFSTLTLTTSSGKHSFFFMDEAEKIKSWIENRKCEELKAA